MLPSVCNRNISRYNPVEQLSSLVLFLRESKPSHQNRAKMNGSTFFVVFAIIPIRAVKETKVAPDTYLGSLK